MCVASRTTETTRAAQVKEYGCRYMCVAPQTSRYLRETAPFRLPQPLSDQFPVRVCSR